MKNSNNNVRKLFDKSQVSYCLVKRSKKFQNNVRGFGCRRRWVHLKGATVHSWLFYERFIFNSVFLIILTTQLLEKNSVVQLSDGRFCEITTLLAFTSEASSILTKNSFCVLVKELAKSEGKVCRDIQLNTTRPYLICH